jgi:hypothetical protein
MTLTSIRERTAEMIRWQNLKRQSPRRLAKARKFYQRFGGLDFRASGAQQTDEVRQGIEDSVGRDGRVFQLFRPKLSGANQDAGATRR